MLKIMIVDDDFVVLNGMAATIDWKSMDCMVVGTAGDGAEALAKIDELKPDIVFTDVVMPRMNGLELLEKLHRTNPEIHVVIVSAYDEASYVRQSMHSDAVEYLLKPYQEKEIREVIEKIRSRIRSEALRHNPDRVADEGYQWVKRLTAKALDALKNSDAREVEQRTRDVFDQVEALGIRSMLFVTTMCVDLLTQAISVVKNMIPDDQELEIAGILDMLSRVHNMEELRETTVRAMKGMALTIENSSADMTRLVRRACEIIEKRFMENITIQQIADELYISVNYLQNHFKQENGMTIRQYITDARVRHAKYLLCCTSNKVADICEQVGYKDTDYFTRVFREATGQTPNEYRRSGGQWK